MPEAGTITVKVELDQESLQKCMAQLEDLGRRLAESTRIPVVDFHGNVKGYVNG